MDTKVQKLDAYLRERTSAIHVRTEAELEPLQLFANLNLRNYATFISIQHKWHLALEKILEATSPYLIFNDYAYALKAPLLQVDLNALGKTSVEYSLPRIHNPAIPGIIYVLEGAMLGGTVISKQLVDKGIDQQFRNYFSHCSLEAKKVWPLTRKYLQNIEDSGHQFDACLKTSIFCFEQMIEITKEEIAKSGL